MPSTATVEGPHCGCFCLLTKVTLVTYDMRFSQQEIDAARRLKELGLNWFPAPGQFVFDEAGVIEQPSPLQKRVYFILDLKHFLRRAGTVDHLKLALFWLPTWHDARELLRLQGVADEEVADALRVARSIESGSELSTLYRLLETGLKRDSRVGHINLLEFVSKPDLQMKES